MRIEDYLVEHAIVKIGKTLPDYISCEIIVDNPYELISVVTRNYGYISEIRWWDCVEITTGSNIGYGGPRDPRNPDHYFFAETDICKKFDLLTENKIYYEYLKQIEVEYSAYNLYPAFDIKRTLIFM